MAGFDALFDAYDITFVVTAFLFQAVLIAHFALRRWRFPLAIRFGPIVYALGIPAAGVSAVLAGAGKPWGLWTAGVLYLLWGLFGYWVEYLLKIEWRSPIRWPVFGPYLLLYLATNMFYWFPLALIWRPLWYVYAVLFLVSTALNAASHQKPQGIRKGPSALPMRR